MYFIFSKNHLHNTTMIKTYNKKNVKISNFEKCVKYALNMKGFTVDTLAKANLRVYNRRTVNSSTVFTVLLKGGIVIPVVNASLLGEYNVGISATVVVKANQISDLVELYVPKSNDIQVFPIATFLEAWGTTDGLCTTAFPPDTHTYLPQLIDLKCVELPKGIEELREAIAENAHDSWALERLSEGWTYGQKRDDSKLETPDMVPYNLLPESEKQYDRIMAENT